MYGYDTEEEGDLDGTLVGGIAIADGEVLVEHRHPSDSLEDAFWTRVSTVLMSSVCGDGLVFTDVHVERLYDMLSSSTMIRTVTHLLERDDARAILEGSGFTYDLACEVYLDDTGNRSGDLYFTTWVRTRPHVRRMSPPRSPVPFPCLLP